MFVPPVKILFVSDDHEATHVGITKTKDKKAIPLFVYKYTKATEKSGKLNKTIEFPQTQIEEMIKKNIVSVIN